MSVASDVHAPIATHVIGSDAALRSAFMRLLSLDPSLAIVGQSPNPDYTSLQADVVIDEALLHDFRDISIGAFIDMVKSLPLLPKPRSSARHLRPIAGDAKRHASLSARQLQVVRLVAEGLTNKDISVRLGLSDKTVKNHISHILAKLQLTARTQVAVYALRVGLV